LSKKKYKNSNDYGNMRGKRTRKNFPAIRKKLLYYPEGIEKAGYNMILHFKEELV